MAFRVDLDQRAYIQIQEAIDYFNDLNNELGQKFFNEISDAIDSLTINPFYQKRYNNVHCLPLKKFPYMIHFTIDETYFQVKIFAVINTFRNPDKYWKS